MKHFFANDPDNQSGMSFSIDPYIKTPDERSDHEKAIDLKFRNKSNWEPPQGDHALETFIQSVTNDFGKMSPKKPQTFKSN